MSTPIELKCYRCVYFTDVEIVSEKKGFFKYTCLAYPKGIPEDIRCWEAESPSAKPRPHTSVQKDQVGEFVFEEIPERPIENITINNILDYQLYDEVGFLGPFATTVELELFRKYVNNTDKYPALKEFLKRGSSLLTQDLEGEIFKIKNDDNKKIIGRLQILIEQAETMILIGVED